MSDISIAGISVMLAMPTNRDIPPQTALSLCATQDALFRAGVEYEIEMQVGCSRVTAARNASAHNFLRSSKQKLFWLDSDMAWEARDFMRLLALSTKLECVGGIYTTKTDPPNFMVNTVPGQFLETNEFGCLPMIGFGLGFTIVSREIMEALAAKAPKVVFPSIEGRAAKIFHEDIDGELDRGEDMAFFADVKALGHEVWLDPSIMLGHIGPKEFKASVMDVLQKEEPNA